MNFPLMWICRLKIHFLFDEICVGKKNTKQKLTSSNVKDFP